MTTGLIVSLGALGLLLVAVGLYGLTSFLVGRRMREIGVRLALGAQPRAIFELVMGQALRLAGAGVFVGAAGAWAAATGLRSLLYGVAPGDVPTFVAATALVAAVTCAAAFVPGRRATKVDPATTLKAE